MGFAGWAGAVAGGAAGVVTAAWLGGAPWCWDELPDGVDAGAAEPDAVSACHSPPNALTPLPVSVPRYQRRRGHLPVALGLWHQGRHRCPHP